MKKVIITALLLLSVTLAYAQQYYPVNKELLQEIKKLYKKEFYLKIDYVAKLVDSDSCYYFLHAKDNRILAILNKNQEIIIKPNFTEKIIYIPERVASIECFSNIIGIKEYWPVPTSKAVFIDEYNKTIYNTDGSIAFSGGDSYINSYPDDNKYYYVRTSNLKSDEYALYTVDGKEIVPLGKHIIGNLQESVKDENNELFYKTRFFYVFKEVDGITYHGAYPITEEDKEKYGIVPTEYNSIRIGDSKLLVKKTSLDNEEEYEKNSTYIAQDRDEGEHYYKQKEYDKVIEYYSKYKDIKPWAVFYSGMAFFEKASEIQSNIRVIHLYLNTKDYLQVKVRNEIIKEGNIDINLMSDFFQKAHDLLDYYINSGDKEFLNDNTKLTCNLSKYYSDINDESYKKTLSQLNDIKEWLKEQIRMAESRAKEQAEAERAERERRQQQKAAFWGSILGAFADGMLKTISNSGYSSSSSSGIGFSSTPSSSSSYSSSSSSYSSSSSDSSGAVDKAKSETRRRELQRQISRYESLLRDAEEFERKCRAEKSYFLGQAIRDVNNYKNKLQELYNEMNGL